MSSSPPSPPLPSSKEEGNGGGRKQNEVKKCGVCGDRALGYNFNAITCESCKAFFRRNALKNKEFKCPFQEQCQVDQVTRRFCQKCRLRKCFEIGMKKEWIMTEEEKRKKKQKIEENRARKIEDMEHDDDDEDDYDGSGGHSQNDKSNSNDNDSNNNESNDEPVSLPSSSSASVSLTKPQAMVVGVIREEDLLPPKLPRIENEANIEHHSQLEPVIRDHQTECLSTSPTDNFAKPREGESSLRAPEPPSPVTVEEEEEEEEASNTCLAEVFAISIKKEVECMDDQPAAALHNNQHHEPDLHTQSPLPHYHQNDFFFHHPPLPPHPSSPHHEPLFQHSPPHPSLSPTHHTPSFINPTPPPTQHTPTPTQHTPLPTQHTPLPTQHTPLPTQHTPLPTQHTPLPTQHTPPPTQHTPLQVHTMSPPPQHNSQSEVLTESVEESEGFSVREAMEIINPEEINSKETTSVMDTLMNTAIRAEYSSPLLSFHLSPPSELNEAERAKLEELTEANKGLLAPLCEDYNFKDLSNPSLINVINLTEIAIRRLIKMAKRISSFKTLCQEDQIALLKGGCTEMMILRSVCAYDPDKDSWKIQQDHSKTQDIKLKVLKAAPGNVYEEHKRFILAFEPEWRRDPHIIFLLCAITLFSPRRPHIIHADAILHEQCSYLYLTRRYLAARYGPCAGRAVYHQLLHRLAHLHRLSEEHVRLFLEVNPKQVEPLLIEIFDLKQR